MNRAIMICFALLLAFVDTGCRKKKEVKSATATTPRSESEVKSPDVVQPPTEASNTATESPEEVAERADFAAIYFGFDSSTLSDTAMSKLDRLGAYLADHPELKVTIAGHADERGTEEFNLALGDERARTAKKYLTRLQIDPARISVVSYGEEMPVTNGNNETAWSKNRRGEFSFSTTQ